MISTCLETTALGNQVFGAKDIEPKAWEVAYTCLALYEALSLVPVIKIKIKENLK